MNYGLVRGRGHVGRWSLSVHLSGQEGHTLDKFTAYTTAVMTWMMLFCRLQVVNSRSNVHLLINAARGAKSETDDRSFDEISYLPDVQIIPMLANIYINKSCKML